MPPPPAGQVWVPALHSPWHVQTPPAVVPRQPGDAWQLLDTRFAPGGPHVDQQHAAAVANNDAQAKILQPNEDEVRVITAIDEDGTVHFEEPLIHLHKPSPHGIQYSVEFLQLE